MLLDTGIGGTDGACCGGRFWGSEGAGPSLRVQEFLSSAVSDSLCEETREIGGSTGGLGETGDSLRLLFWEVRGRGGSKLNVGGPWVGGGAS